MKHSLVISLVLPLCSLAQWDPDSDERYELEAKKAGQDKLGVGQQVTSLDLALSDTTETEPEQQEPEQPLGPQPDSSSSAKVLSAVEAKLHAKNAREAAKVAKKAAAVANKVAEHSVKVTGQAKKALKHALGALHDARVESSGLDRHQTASLKKAEAHLREATKSADYGKLKKNKNERDLQKEKMQEDLGKADVSKSEKEELSEEIKELRRKLKEKKVDDEETRKALDELESAHDKSDGTNSDETKAELERLREQVDRMEASDGKDKDRKHRPMQKDSTSEASEALAAKAKNVSSIPGQAEEIATPIQEKGFDIDTQMPFGDLEPFGREDTAQELTERSIKESDEMVDQVERAEVAEEKRSVFRALTRLRGAAITSYDGVARSQTGNIDEYNKIQKWRKAHPLHHLADEESDVTKWAFPDNAD